MTATAICGTSRFRRDRALTRNGELGKAGSKVLTSARDLTSVGRAQAVLAPDPVVHRVLRLLALPVSLLPLAATTRACLRNKLCLAALVGGLRKRRAARPYRARRTCRSRPYPVAKRWSMQARFAAPACTGGRPPRIHHRVGSRGLAPPAVCSPLVRYASAAPGLQDFSVPLPGSARGYGSFHVAQLASHQTTCDPPRSHNPTGAGSQSCAPRP